MWLLLWMEMEDGAKSAFRAMQDIRRAADGWRRSRREAWQLGIKYLTPMLFFIENWSRPEDEVRALLKILEKLFEGEH